MTSAAAAAKDASHAANLTKIAAAKAKEKAARRMRREGRDEDAIVMYDHARDLYADTNLVYHEHGESKLAKEVLGAIKRCDAILSNIRHHGFLIQAIRYLSMPSRSCSVKDAHA